jgi:hypothetical protein
MNGTTNILKVEKDGEDGVIVMFSDGTIDGCVAEEFLELRPSREHVEKPVKSDRPTIVQKISFSMGGPCSK